MRISVVQPGARLHYAVPEILAKAGVLRALHTDLHGEHRAIRLLDRLLPAGVTPKALRRLTGRRLPRDLPASLVRDHPVAALSVAIRGRGVPSRRLLADLESCGLGEGDTVYTVLVNEDVETMRRLKDRGVTIVHECIIGPDVGLHMIEEAARFPGLEPAPDPNAVEAGRARDREKYAVSDAVLTPSAFTDRAVADLSPVTTRKLVPYGMDIAQTVAPRPKPGRVLAVGSVGLRKGHPDLAAAARLLTAQGSRAEVRVVGPADPDFARHPLLAGPTYVGQVPRSAVMEEFARADVLAFPTICDSFGLVLLEAMAMGVPVVCTPHCGDVVRDGIDGFVVPVRDPEALADRIDRIVSDRDLRARMSASALERARDFSLDAYAGRLLAALGEVAA